ncbi:IS1096 element passenger TnpR family protein [Natrialbaceae archaeon A-CW1-1]
MRQKGLKPRNFARRSKSWKGASTSSRVSEPARKCEITVYRFRVKLEWDPTALWRAIVVGEDRTLAEFQAVINESMGSSNRHR